MNVSQVEQNRACTTQARHFIAGGKVVGKEKVIPIDQLRKRRAERQMKLEGIQFAELPPYVEEYLQAENEKVLAVFRTLDDALTEYSKNNATGSFLIPIEALARMIVSATSSIDMQMPEHELLEQAEFRNELSADILDLIDLVVQERQFVDQGKVYKHDLYISLVMALLSLIFEHRLVQIQIKQKGVVSRVEPNFTDNSSEGKISDVQCDGAE